MKNPSLSSIYGEAGMIWKAQVGKSAAAYTELRFRAGNEWESNFSEWQIRESYVDLYSRIFDLRAGKQIIRTGKGTFFNPEDWLTPLNPTVRAPEEDEMRLGIWAVKGDFHPWRPLNLSASWIPVYTPSTLFTDLISLPEALRFTEPDFPDLRLKSGSYSIRMDLRTRLVDLSGSWFEGYSHWPGIAFDSLIINSMTYSLDEITLRQLAYRIRAAGGDLAIPAGKFVFRAEGAWRSSTAEQPESWQPMDEWSYTAELERSGDYLTVIAGYYGKYILNFTPPSADLQLFTGDDPSEMLAGLPQPVTPAAISAAIGGQVDLFNRLYNYQMEEFYHRAFGVIRLDLFHEQFRIDLPFIWDFTSEEYLARPGIEVVPADGLSLKAGYQVYGGPDKSLYSLIKNRLNGPWLTMKLSF